MASAIFQLKNQQLLDLQTEKIIKMHIKKKRHFESIFRVRLRRQRKK